MLGYSFDKYGKPFFILSAWASLPSDGYTLFSHALFLIPGLGPATNVHLAMVVSHS